MKRPPHPSYVYWTMLVVGLMMVSSALGALAYIRQVKP